jgi:hypothetical protein
LQVENSGQLAGVAAFAGDEAEILESVGKKGAKVLFAVGDTGSRRHLSMTESGASRVLFWIDVIHAAPLQRMCACSGTSAQWSQRWNFLDAPMNASVGLKPRLKLKL